MCICIFVCMRVPHSYITTETTHPRFDTSTPRQAGRQAGSQPTDEPAANHPVDRVIMTARLTPTGYASLMVLVPLPAAAPTIHGRAAVYISPRPCQVVPRRIFIILHRVSAKSVSHLYTSHFTISE